MSDAANVEVAAADDAVPLVPEGDSLVYEEELLRNPYSLKLWLRYLEKGKSETPFKVRRLLFERALKALPGSYKLWNMYLRERRDRIKHKCITDPAFEAVNNTFERALVFMHKMPRIWIDYCKFLQIQRKVTKTRHTYDRALRSLLHASCCCNCCCGRGGLSRWLRPTPRPAPPPPPPPHVPALAPA